MTFAELCSHLKQGESEIVFNDVIALIDDSYHFTATAFDNGTLHNDAGENNGSCKLFAFAKQQGFSQAETLACFGEHYQSVRNDPKGDSHQNIRHFMQTGWEGIRFSSEALQP